MYVSKELDVSIFNIEEQANELVSFWFLAYLILGP